MKIIDIEAIPIYPALARRYDNPAGRGRMGGIDSRMVFKVTTDVGVIGYGDYDWPGPPPPPSMFERLIDRSPFDFMCNDFNLGLGSALYDAMGKYLEVPVYKLLGQKVRGAMTVAAWTRPCPADVFAQEVQRSREEGYMVFKMHTNSAFDPLEQAVADDGGDLVLPSGADDVLDPRRHRRRLLDGPDLLQDPFGLGGEGVGAAGQGVGRDHMVDPGGVLEQGHQEGGGLIGEGAGADRDRVRHLQIAGHLVEQHDDRAACEHLGEGGGSRSGALGVGPGDVLVGAELICDVPPDRAGDDAPAVDARRQVG